MVDIASRPAPADRNGAAPTGARQVHRRRSLPGSRAVVGGFLVAAAAVGTFGTYAAANGGPGGSVVVLTRDVGPGEQLASEDLALVAAEFPAPQRATVVDDLAAATGAVAISPLEQGQLLATSDVVKLAGLSGRGQLSIPVDPARANNGQLTPGELVDVIATATSASSTTTETIAADAVVVRVFTGDRSLGSTSNVVVTLSLAAEELEPVADAAAGATISLARVSGLERRPAGEAVDETRAAEGTSRDADADASAGTAPTGTAPTGTAPTGTATTGTATTGTATTGTATTGGTPDARTTDTGPAGTGATDGTPADTVPAGTGATDGTPADTVPAGTGATGTEPTSSEPTDGPPADTGPGGTPTDTGPAGTPAPPGG